jgi:ABC-type branched-chain amino acid transport systems, ATPase component
MILEVQNLSKTFGGLRAINNLSFSIRKHEIMGIIGPNGSGKTTLFNLLTGFLRPTEGKVMFQGQSIDSLPIHKIAQRGVTRTFQVTRIIKEASLLNNVMMGLLPTTQHGVWDALISQRKKEDQRFKHRCWEILKMVDLEEVSAHLAGELDQEQQKRLSIAIAMATNPQLLLLDEPTGGINVEEIHKLTKIIRSIWAAGVTVCLIEHKMEMVTELCQRIMVLNYGEKIAEGTPEEVMRNENAIRVYLGEEYVA